MLKASVFAGLVLAFFSTSALAQVPRVRLLSRPPLLIASQSIAQGDQTQIEWQRQYDAAQAKEKSGKKKLLIGGGLLVGGAVVAMAQAGEASTGGIIFGNMIMLGGAGTAAWGVMEWSNASSKLTQLELMRAQRKTAFSIPIGRNQALAMQVGRTDFVQYQLNW